jgi:hypothetical protein
LADFQTKETPVHKTISAFLAAAALGSQIAYAQPKAPQGAAVVISEPGKASAATVVEATATVVAINAKTRVVTLKGASGKTMDVVAGDEVKNFSQIHVGDNVTIQYREALTLELKKTKDAANAAAAAGAVAAPVGAQPAAAAVAQVTVLADVVAIDPKKSTISLKGPAGNVVDLKVNNPDHFKVVRKGDKVEVTYSEAMAIAVTPAQKTEGKKAETKKK